MEQQSASLPEHISYGFRTSPEPHHSVKRKKKKVGGIINFILVAIEYRLTFSYDVFSHSLLYILLHYIWFLCHHL